MHIFQRKPDGSYYVRFEFKLKGYLRSTGCTNKAAAEKNAKLIVNAIRNERFDEAEKMKVRSDVATFGAVYDRYSLSFPDRKQNVAAMSLIIRDVLGESVEPRNEKLSILTRDFALKFHRVRMERAKKEDKGFVDLERVKITINSMLRKARCLFSENLLNDGFYEGMKLSDISGFMKAPRLKELKRGFKPIEQSVIDEMFKGSQDLKNENPRLYLVHLLFQRLALRNIEIFHAKKTWIVMRGDKRFLEIITRDDFKPKGKEGAVAIPDDVYEEIQKHSDENGFIVPGRTKTDRWELIYRRHSEWIRQFLPDRQKSSYELRKLAGSIIAMKYGLFVAQGSLRHKDPKTTSDNYASLLTPPPALEQKDFSVSFEK